MLTQAHTAFVHSFICLFIEFLILDFLRTVSLHSSAVDAVYPQFHTVNYTLMVINAHCAHVSLHNFVHISALVSHRIYMCRIVSHSATSTNTFFENVALSISLCGRARSYRRKCLFDSII